MEIWISNRQHHAVLISMVANLRKQILHLISNSVMLYTSQWECSASGPFPELSSRGSTTGWSWCHRTLTGTP